MGANYLCLKRCPRKRGNQIEGVRKRLKRLLHSPHVLEPSFSPPSMLEGQGGRREECVNEPWAYFTPQPILRFHPPTQPPIHPPIHPPTTNVPPIVTRCPEHATPHPTPKRGVAQRVITDLDARRGLNPLLPLTLI